MKNKFTLSIKRKTASLIVRILLQLLALDFAGLILGMGIIDEMQIIPEDAYNSKRKDNCCSYKSNYVKYDPAFNTFCWLFKEKK